jgi:hypothetical protein
MDFNRETIKVEAAEPTTLFLPHHSNKTLDVPVILKLEKDL